MNTKEGLKLVVGSVVVYVVMAACAGAGTMSPSDTSAGGSSSGGVASASGSSSGNDGSDGSGSSGGSTGDDSGGTSFLDALTDPVPAAQADTTQSGSRLKAKYYVGSDGSKEFAGWHDSMLNVDCGFVPASDGTTRCMPAYPGAALVELYFSDSGCTQALALGTKGCAAPLYAFQSQAGMGSACVTGFDRIFQLGAAYTGALYTGSPASCVTIPSPTTYSLYSLGPEVSPSTFVAATLQTDP